MKKIIIAVVSVMLVLCITSCNIIINNPDTTSEQSGDVTEKVYPHSNMELAPLDAIIATTEHQQIPVAVFKYYFMDQYSSFISNYYYYLSYYGLDTDVPVHDQAYLGTEEESTWYDFFLERGKDAFEQYAKFAEMAIKEGITLDEDDYKMIEDNLDSIQKIADSYSMTFEEYMKQYMGEGMTRERIKAATELSQLGYKYYLKLYNGPVYTEEQIEAEYKNGAGKYSLVDYYETTIKALYDETDTDEQITAAKAEAKSKAEKMKELIDGGKSFAEAYNTIYPPETNTEETTDTTDTTDTSEESTEKSKVPEDSDFAWIGMGYDEDDAYKFLYEESTKEGQVNIYCDDSGNATVVQCIKLPYKDTTRILNIRHILLSSVDYDTEEEAYAQAQKLLEQINNAEDKKAEFLSLVEQYSSDTGSKTKGGLYENISPGQTVPEFDEWCFNEERNVGDTGIVKSDYGYHIMYMESFGGETWHYNCDTALRDAEFNEKAEEIYNSVVITYNEDLTDRIIK